MTSEKLTNVKVRRAFLDLGRPTFFPWPFQRRTFHHAEKPTLEAGAGPFATESSTPNHCRHHCKYRHAQEDTVVREDKEI